MIGAAFLFVLYGSRALTIGIILMCFGIMIFIMGRIESIKRNVEIEEHWEKYRQEKEQYLKTVNYEKKKAWDNFLRKSILQTNLKELEEKIIKVKIFFRIFILQK